MNILGQSDIQHVVSDEFPDLTGAICEMHGQKVRRIDRYIELCLLGALRCTQSHDLPTNTGLFLASQNCALSSVVKVMESIFQEHFAPKPFDFVNTLGNSACFYVAQLLGLSGKSISLSREGFSFESGLYHALLDLDSGECRTALVGCVDEVLMPLSTHRLRIASDKNRPVEGPLGETSSWILLENGDSGAADLRLDAVMEFSSHDDLLASLSKSGADEMFMQTCYQLADGEREPLASVVSCLKEYRAPFAVGSSDTNSAASIMALLADSDTQRNYGASLHLNKNSDGEYILVRFIPR